jgi:hypothetical protein
MTESASVLRHTDSYGVDPNKKRWEARIQNITSSEPGAFANKQEAALAYKYIDTTKSEARKCGEKTLLFNYESIKAAKEAATEAQAERTTTEMCTSKARASGDRRHIHGLHAPGRCRYRG